MAKKFTPEEDDSELVSVGTHGEAGYGESTESIEPTVKAKPKPVEIAPIRELLQVGSKGPAVRKLQEKLNEQLPSAQPLVVDEDYGIEVRKRVLALQTRVGLDRTGDAGPQVCGYLGI
jgi:peptidoglycan hydrolase-like protein with peptidoglycan-binding domain